MPIKKFDKIINEFLLENIKQNSRVIDIGCGTGQTALLLARNKSGCFVDGLDLNELKIHRANELFLKAKRDHLLTCRLFDARKITSYYKSSSFDYVISNHTIHHLEDPMDVLRKIKQILKPGGKLLLTDLERSYGEKIDNCPRYSLKKILEMVKTAGFSVESSEEKQGVFLIVARK